MGNIAYTECVYPLVHFLITNHHTYTTENSESVIKLLAIRLQICKLYFSYG